VTRNLWLDISHPNFSVGPEAVELFRIYFTLIVIMRTEIHKDTPSHESHFTSNLRSPTGGEAYGMPTNS
jgi:hypothetical protein